MKFCEQQVRHGVGTGNERPQTPHKRSHHGPGVPGNGGNGPCQCQRHGRIAVRVQHGIIHAGPLEDGDQRHCEQQGNGRVFHLGNGFRPRASNSVPFHPVNQNGQQGHQRERNGTRQIQVSNTGFHRRMPQESHGNMQLQARQQSLQSQLRNPGYNQDQADQQVGQPCPKLAHMCPVFRGGHPPDLTGPCRVPIRIRTKIPGCFGNAESPLRSRNDNPETRQATDQRREFGSKKPGKHQVRNGEGNGCKQRKLPGRKSVRPPSIRSKVPGNKAQHEHRENENHGQVQQGDPLTDDHVERVIPGEIDPRIRGHRVRHQPLQRRQAQHHRCAHCPERHRERIQHQAEHRRGQWWKSQ